MIDDDDDDDDIDDEHDHEIVFDDCNVHDNNDEDNVRFANENYDDMTMARIMKLTLLTMAMLLMFFMPTMMTVGRIVSGDDDSGLLNTFLFRSSGTLQCACTVSGSVLGLLESVLVSFLYLNP
jgi:hypothetical protein